MGLGLTLTLVVVAVFATLLAVLYRRKRLSRGGDLWVAGQERQPCVGEVADTTPHVDGGIGITGSGGGGY